MKRSIIPLITAGLLAGTAQAQLVEYNSASNYVTDANNNLTVKPMFWTNADSTPGSDYNGGPSFSFAGLTATSNDFSQARIIKNNDRLQFQASENFQYMLAFDFAASQVGQINLKISTFGAGVAGDASYVILHDSTQSYSNGWYATLLHDRTAVSAVRYGLRVKDMMWYEFTPSTATNYPLGTLGAAVSTSTMTNALFDQVGIFADVESNGGVANHYIWEMIAHEPTSAPLHPTLATFDTTFTSPDFAVAGLSGSLVGEGGKSTTINSSDGTYGSVVNPGAEIFQSGVVRVTGQNTNLTATLTLNNTSTKDLFLDDLSFDTARLWNDTPNAFTLSTSGDISEVTLTNHTSGLTALLDGSGGDADDFDISLAGLADNTLEPGGQAIFTWEYTAGASPLSGSPTILDNVLIGGTVSPFFTAELLTTPSVLSLQIDADNQSADSDIAVSYVEGNPATNVNVSSVSILNDSSAGGFSVSPSSFTLSSPASTQLVNVDYVNSFASSPIAVNEDATANVQIIWNEVGSASSSTSTVPVSVTYYGVTEDNLLAVWHNHFNQAGRTPEISFTGVDAFMGPFTGWRQSNAGSTDGSYGTVVSTNAVLTAGNAAMNANGSVVVSLTNLTGNVLDLNSINFDVNSLWGGPTNFSLSMAGDLGVSNLLVDAAVPALTMLSDWTDYDINLNGSLQDGEYVEFTFSWAGSGGSLGLDNLALIGEGFAPATLGRVPGGPNHPWVSMGVSGLDSYASQAIDLIFAAGDLNTNVTITGVTVSNTTHEGALSASGSFDVLLPDPNVTNSAVFTLEFDNTVANLAEGEFAEGVVSVEWYEGPSGPRYYEFLAYGDRPDASPSNTVIGLWHTEFYTPDAAMNGVLGGFTEGTGIQPHNDSNGQRFGSKNGTYGTRVINPPAPGNGNDDLTAWRFQMNEPTTSLTITNQTTAAIELSELAFDIGRWYESFDSFTLGVSGDVTADPSFFVGALLQMGWEQSIKDYDEYDVDLTTLPDHTLEAGESVTFTFSVPATGDEDYRWIGIYLDNIALFGATDQLGGWGNYYGLTSGVNDGPYDNPDGDSKNNMMEYATGGDPMTADGSVATIWTEEQGGTNWLYHVHNERQDDDSLTFNVGTKELLQYDPVWDETDAEEVGATTGPGLWKTVTNRTEIADDVDAKFIGLEVQQD